jgi:site-specific DNA-adenine methylase
VSRRGHEGNPLGGYPSEGQYGHKKFETEAILRHIPPGAKTLADPFGGTGVVAWAAKRIGLEVATSDIMAFSALRLKVFIANDRTVLDEADVGILLKVNPAAKDLIEELYGSALGQENAAFLDGLASNLPLLDSDSKRDVAVCLAVLCVMRHMNYSCVTFGHDGRFTGRRTIEQADLRADFHRMALVEFPRLLRDDLPPCRASRGDALTFVAETPCDVLYLDPPFASPASRYQRDLGFYDKLVHLLCGQPDQIGRPRVGLPILPPHTDFTGRKTALMGIKLLFKAAARQARRVVFSFNSTSEVKPYEVIMAARDWYGGLTACEWYPGQRPTCSNRRRKTTTNVVMVFDRARPTASPKWNPEDVTFAHLFSGIGEFRLAIQLAGGRCVFSSEIDKNAVATYRANSGELQTGDIMKAAPDDIPEHLVLCAEFPCPAFSISGNGSDFDDKLEKMFFEIPRIAAIRRPCVLILANVPASVSPSKPSFSRAKEVLEGIGYRVFSKVINTGHHGVRPVHERVHIVCFREDLGITAFDFPATSIEPELLADVLLSDAETVDRCPSAPPNSNLCP